MAVTNRKEEPNMATGTAAAGTQAPKYTGMQGVSNPTAQRLGQAQQGYTQGQQVTAAQDTLSRIQANRPQSYNSKYQPMLDDIMAKIQNPGEFKYEFNGDNLFKNYADLYTQKGKQASLDTMGQAAALTGGYGNSYAQAAGNQAYQQYLLSLYDRGMDLHDRAYQKYRDNLGDLKDQYGMLQSAEDTDYGRYRDTVADWTNEEQQAYNRMMDAQNFDYTQYQNDLNYWTGLAQVENAAWTTEQQRQEAIRQYNQNYAMDTIMRIAANGQMPSAELLRAAGLSEADARAMMAQIQPAGGGGGGSYSPRPAQEQKKDGWLDDVAEQIQDFYGATKRYALQGILDYSQALNNQLNKQNQTIPNYQSGQTVTSTTSGAQYNNSGKEDPNKKKIN